MASNTALFSSRVRAVPPAPSAGLPGQSREQRLPRIQGGLRRLRALAGRRREQDRHQRRQYYPTHGPHPEKLRPPSAAGQVDGDGLLAGPAGAARGRGPQAGAVVAPPGPGVLLGPGGRPRSGEARRPGRRQWPGAARVAWPGRRGSALRGRWPRAGPAGARAAPAGSAGGGRTPRRRCGPRTVARPSAGSSRPRPGHRCRCAHRCSRASRSLRGPCTAESRSAPGSCSPTSARRSSVLTRPKSTTLAKSADAALLAQQDVRRA